MGNLNQHKDSSSTSSYSMQAQVAGFEHDGQVAVTVAAMRCAADLLERIGIAELSVTCYADQLSVQVPDHLGSAGERAAIVAAIAQALHSIPYQHATPGGQHCWLHACGVIRGIQTRISTSLRIERGTGGGLLARTPAGDLVELAEGNRLPTGHHWLTELDAQGPADDAIGSAAAGHEVVLS